MAFYCTNVFSFFKKYSKYHLNSHIIWNALCIIITGESYVLHYTIICNIIIPNIKVTRILLYSYNTNIKVTIILLYSYRQINYRKKYMLFDSYTFENGTFSTHTKSFIIINSTEANSSADWTILKDSSQCNKKLLRSNIYVIIKQDLSQIKQTSNATTET